MTVRSAHYYDHDLHVCECGCITVRTMRGFGKIQRWDSGSDRGGTGPSCGAGQHLVILTGLNSRIRTSQRICSRSGRL